MSEPVNKRLFSELTPEKPDMAKSDIKQALCEALTAYGLDKVQKELEEIKTSLQDISDRNSEVEHIAKDNQTKIQILDSQIQSLQLDLNFEKEQRLELETRMRRDNLKFLGIPEKEKENTETLLQEVLTKHFGLKNVHLDRCHRLGPRNTIQPAKPRPIIAKFTYFKDRQAIWINRMKLKDTNIILKEDFPHAIEERNMELLPIFKAAKRNKELSVSLVTDKLFINNQKFTVNNLHTLPDNLKPENLATQHDEETVYFWSKHSLFSNFYPCTFQEDSKSYNRVEQYFVMHKAHAFNDELTEAWVMKCNDPKLQKKARVKNFDKKKWELIAPDIMEQALRLKFSQNPHLEEALLKTGQKTLCEASPYDKYWGIGLGLNNPNRAERSKWGKNMLGQLLMKIREELRSK